MTLIEAEATLLTTPVQTIKDFLQAYGPMTSRAIARLCKAQVGLNLEGIDALLASEGGIFEVVVPGPSDWKVWGLAEPATLKKAEPQADAVATQVPEVSLDSGNAVTETVAQVTETANA
jgi:hypothetical protein